MATLLSEQRTALESELATLRRSHDDQGVALRALREEKAQLLERIRRLEAAAAAKPAPAPAPAAAPSKKAGSRVLVGLDIDEGSDKSVAEQLRDALSKHAIKVMDLFREWDENGDGNVSKKEFRRAMGLLGFDVPKTEIDALFDAFDPDGSGAMEFKELQKMLRHTAPAADPKAVVSARRASVAAGGRGKGKK